MTRHACGVCWEPATYKVSVTAEGIEVTEWACARHAQPILDFLNKQMRSRKDPKVKRLGLAASPLWLALQRRRDKEA